jgi:hypothetical protein
MATSNNGRRLTPSKSLPNQAEVVSFLNPPSHERVPCVLLTCLLSVLIRFSLVYLNGRLIRGVVYCMYGHEAILQRNKTTAPSINKSFHSAVSPRSSESIPDLFPKCYASTRTFASNGGTSGSLVPTVMCKEFRSSSDSFDPTHSLPDLRKSGCLANRQARSHSR